MYFIRIADRRPVRCRTTAARAPPVGIRVDKYQNVMGHRRPAQRISNKRHHKNIALERTSHGIKLACIRSTELEMTTRVRMLPLTTILLEVSSDRRFFLEV